MDFIVVMVVRYFVLIKQHNQCLRIYVTCMFHCNCDGPFCLRTYTRARVEQTERRDEQQVSTYTEGAVARIHTRNKMQCKQHNSALQCFVQRDSKVYFFTH